MLILMFPIFYQRARLYFRILGFYLHLFLHHFIFHHLLVDLSLLQYFSLFQLINHFHFSILHLFWFHSILALIFDCLFSSVILRNCLQSIHYYDQLIFKNRFLFQFIHLFHWFSILYHPYWFIKIFLFHHLKAHLLSNI